MGKLLDPTKYKVITQGFKTEYVTVPKGVYPVKEIHEDGFVVMDGLNGWSIDIPLSHRLWYGIQVDEK